MNPTPDSPRELPRPLRNSYWVEPGRLLAGEYPGGATLAATTERVQALLTAGVTLFVDLTREGELGSYAPLLDYAASDRPIRHMREPIRDHDVPDSIQVAQRVVAAIEAHLADNGIAYVHCRAGIGRTGLMVGCYLARNGLDAETTLERLNRLWCESERSRTWPSIPETDEQFAFIRRWCDHVRELRGRGDRHDSRAVSEETLDRFRGALLGLAIGDALGAQTKGKRGANPADLSAGAWFSDTAMTFCLAQSLLACGGNDAQDQMERYWAWQRDVTHAGAKPASTVPEEVRRALAQWQWNRKPIAGSHDPANRDPHPLARTVAVALYYANDVPVALQEAGEAVRPTLQTPVVLDVCRAYAALLSSALQGDSKNAVIALRLTAAGRALRQRRLKADVVRFVDGAWRETSSSKDIESVLSAALRAFEDSDTFAAGLALAVKSNAIPATVGAVYGALAGAYYGARQIPADWRQAVFRSAVLIDTAERLAARLSHA